MQFTGGDESVLLIFSAGCHIKIGKENGDFFAVFIPKYCGVKISFCFFHNYFKVAHIKIFVNERFLGIDKRCSGARLIMKNWQRQLLHPLRLLGRGFRPSAGSESAYDFRKEDLIPFTVPLC